MNELVNLRELCLKHDGRGPIALTSGGDLSAEALRHQVLALAGVLAARPEERWAIWLQKPSEFLTAFLAAAMAGKALVLPGNMQPGTARLLAEQFDGLITDQEFAELNCPRVAVMQEALLSAEFRPDTRNPVQITLFTSGSTGEPKAICKSLALLESELAMQQRQWGGQVGRLPVFSTVSHQHIYGLLHAVLWPFLRGAPFVDDVCQYPEELVERAERHPEVVLVSSPTHLARLPESPALKRATARFAAVFSSGGPLSQEAALAMTSVTGATPIEILGSTETGGVAWRQQQSSSPVAWRPLPGVQVSTDSNSGCLAVWAPHLGQDEAYVMGDRVDLLADGRFVMQGRADRVVEVEGKRLSVSEMERHLVESHLVREARVAVIRGKREEVGAVVVLSSAGEDWLAQQGKLALNRHLRDRLLAFFERPLVPRRWRYLAELPYNAQGKITADVLTRILQREAQ